MNPPVTPPLDDYREILLFAICANPNQCLDNPEFIDAHKRSPHYFTRQRTLTFKRLAQFVLNQPQSALKTELDHFFQVLQQAPFELCYVTASEALSKARHKLLPEPFQRLNQVLQGQLDLNPTWHRLHLLAVDGSNCHRPLGGRHSS